MTERRWFQKNDAETVVIEMRPNISAQARNIVGAPDLYAMLLRDGYDVAPKHDTAESIRAARYIAESIRRMRRVYIAMDECARGRRASLV